MVDARRMFGSSKKRNPDPRCWHECPACKATGRLEIFRGGKQVDERCTACRGSGYLRNKHFSI